MAKRSLVLSDFSGGLVTEKSNRALADNELAECTNFDVSSPGKIQTSRIFKRDTSVYADQTNHSGTAIVPGYGMALFVNDVEISATGTANTKEFICKTDSNTLDILEQEDGSWRNGQAGTVATAPAFYAAEGDLFIGGTTSGSHTTPRSLVLHDRVPIPSDADGGSPDLAYKQWITSTQGKIQPDGSTAGKAMKLYQSTAAGTGTAVSDTADDILVWIIKPGGSSSGLWTADISEDDQKYEFRGTWLFKNEAESEPFNLSVTAGEADISNVGLYVQALYNQDAPITADTIDNGIYGARLYVRYSGDSGDYYLLAEMDLEKGIKGDGETEWSSWTAVSGGDNFDLASDAGHKCATGLISSPPALLSFSILNGYSTGDIPDTDNSASGRDRIVGFKTGLIANSRAYIGNVSLNGREFGDRILKSPIFQYDVFTESNYLDVAINDGDSVTALAAYGDRLLQFKNNSLYIINVSKDLEFLEDEQKGAGVSWQAAVVDTPFGVAWVNTNGCYLYDGEQVAQLQIGKISAEDWETNISSNATIGYDAAHKQLIVIWDASANAASSYTAAQGADNSNLNAYVFNAETGGWNTVHDIISDTVGITNTIQARGERLIVGGGAANNYINYIADRGAAAAGFSLKTKVLDLGNAENKKNLLEVAIVYNGRGNAASAVNVITTADDGSVTTTDLGDLTETDGETTTKEFNTSTTTALQGQKTFQIVLTGTFDHRFEAYSITLTYRDIGNH